MVDETGETKNSYEVALGGWMLNLRRSIHGDGCIAVDYGIGPGHAAHKWAEQMEGWGASLTVAADPDGVGLALDSLALPRLDVLLFCAPVGGLSCLGETVKRLQPYLILNVSPPDDVIVGQFLFAAGYTKVVKENGLYFALPPNDPNWSKVKKAA